MNHPSQAILDHQQKQWNKVIGHIGTLPDRTPLQNKRLLILGGSYLQIPAILEARSLGITTAVLDYNPDCPGRDLADHFYLESTVDNQAVLECAVDFATDGIMTLGTDWPMRSVAYAAEALDLCSISFSSACRSTNKLEMIQRFHETGVAHPDFIFFDAATQTAEDLAGRIPYPCIIKPVDSSGSRGVVLLREPQFLKESLAYSANYSKSGQLIIEEFMVGPEVSVEVLIRDGEPQILTITDKVTTGFPHFVETMHTQPSRLSRADQMAINELARRACKELELKTGSAHVEIIVTADGPKIVEVGPRMGGDFISTHLVPLSTGINMTQLVLLASLGCSPSLPPRQPAGSCIRYVNRGPGRFLQAVNLDSVRTMPGVVDADLFIKPGCEVKDLHSSLDRLGYIITQGRTAREAEDLAIRADQALIIEMEHH